jgi:hypothetical protein
VRFVNESFELAGRLVVNGLIVNPNISLVRSISKYGVVGFRGGFMNQTSRILSFMIDRNTADELDQLIPADQQSKFVSQAIANELAMHRRKMVVSEMLEDCVGMPIIAHGKLQSDLAEDRKRG